MFIGEAHADCKLYIVNLWFRACFNVFTSAVTCLYVSSHFRHEKEWS